MIKKKNILLSGKTIAYTIRKSKRAKRIRLVVSEAKGLEIVIPKSQSLRDIEHLIKSRSQWVLEKLDYIKSKLEEIKPLRENSPILFLGKELILKCADNLYEKEVYKDDSNIYINFHLFDKLDDSQEKIIACLQNWYKDQAKKIIPDRVRYYSSLYAFKYNKITVKNQKRRWGSCSSLGNLNFNWRLVMSPIEIIDYLVIHELVHLEYPNHSKTYWQTVELYCSDYKEHEKWLNKNGSKLTF